MRPVVETFHNLNKSLTADVGTYYEKGNMLVDGITKARKQKKDLVEEMTKSYDAYALAHHGYEDAVSKYNTKKKLGENVTGTTGGGAETLSVLEKKAHEKENERNEKEKIYVSNSSKAENFEKSYNQLMTESLLSFYTLEYDRIEKLASNVNLAINTLSQFWDQGKKGLTVDYRMTEFILKGGKFEDYVAQKEEIEGVDDLTISEHIRESLSAFAMARDKNVKKELELKMKPLFPLRSIGSDEPILSPAAQTISSPLSPSSNHPSSPFSNTQSSVSFSYGIHPSPKLNATTTTTSTASISSIQSKAQTSTSSSSSQQIRSSSSSNTKISLSISPATTTTKHSQASTPSSPKSTSTGNIIFKTDSHAKKTRNDSDSDEEEGSGGGQEGEGGNKGYSVSVEDIEKAMEEEAKELSGKRSGVKNAGGAGTKNSTVVPPQSPVDLSQFTSFKVLRDFTPPDRRTEEEKAQDAAKEEKEKEKEGEKSKEKKHSKKKMSNSNRVKGAFYLKAGEIVTRVSFGEVEVKHAGWVYVKTKKGKSGFAPDSLLEGV